jgi:hypothetical protein
MDEDLQDLKEQTTGGDRIDSEADSDTRAELTDAILEQYQALEAGEKQETVSVWDQDIAALLFTLDDADGEYQDHLAEALSEKLDRSASDDPDRSEVIRLALRVGLREAPDHIRQAHRQAAREHRDPGI